MIDFIRGFLKWGDETRELFWGEKNLLIRDLGGVCDPCERVVKSVRMDELCDSKREWIVWYDGDDVGLVYVDDEHVDDKLIDDAHIMHLILLFIFLFSFWFFFYGWCMLFFADATITT